MLEITFLYLYIKSYKQKDTYSDRTEVHCLWRSCSYCYYENFCETWPCWRTPSGSLWNNIPRAGENYVLIMIAIRLLTYSHPQRIVAVKSGSMRRTDQRVLPLSWPVCWTFRQRMLKLNGPRDSPVPRASSLCTDTPPASCWIILCKGRLRNYNLSMFHNVRRILYENIAISSTISQKKINRLP